nr:hypothetical protein 3 [Coxiellaceae bacterium]
MMLASVACLSGCASLRKPDPIPDCPFIRSYTAEDWQAVAEAVKPLPWNSPLIPLLQDYLDMVDVCTHDHAIL